MNRRVPIIGSQIHHTAITTSTMDDVARLATEGAPEGLVLSADTQTAGRGRRQRQWESEQGQDLLFSILFRPRPAIAVELNMLMPLAIAELVEHRTGHATHLKWPNDVRVNGAKIAGILLESQQGATGLSVVAGVGLNLNSRMADRNPGGTRAVSMRDITEREFDRNDVLQDLIARVDSLYDGVRAGGTVVPAWRNRLETIGQHVTVTFTGLTGPRKSLSGVAEDVDVTGRLVVRDKDGRAWPVSAGEVTLRSDGA